MRSASQLLASLFAFLLALSTFAWTQTATTSLRGTVTDPKGAVLQGATVTLNDAATGFSRTTKTGSDGVYQFLQVPPATYTLTVVASGFGTLKRDNVALQVSLPATVDISMEVKGRSEVVEVTGEATSQHNRRNPGECFRSRANSESARRGARSREYPQLAARCGLCGEKRGPDL